MNGFCDKELMDMLLRKSFRFLNLSVLVYDDSDVNEHSFNTQ